MLKDKLKNLLNNSSKGEMEPLKINIADGFVDIKGYKVSDDGTKKLIYHDCGDNVVTDWMRHVIITMLTGSNFSRHGENNVFNDSGFSMDSNKPNTIPVESNHKEGNNLDGYLLNSEQYFWNFSKLNKKYSISNFPTNIYALFPTKILFGTGKEYFSWDDLREENEVSNAAWYKEMINKYGGDEVSAESNFNDLINANCNYFSGSLEKDLFSDPTYESTIKPARTVNDPSVSSKTIVSNNRTMNKDFGVVGAIKTSYFDKVADAKKLEQAVSDSGKLLKAKFSGIGRPCFIYLNTPSEGKEGWDDPGTDISLTHDSTINYLNKITYKIQMPAQSAATNTVNDYYPYNGFRLKQMGLYNDSKLKLSPDKDDEKAIVNINANMPAGMLLAKKNITAIDKTADVELIITWTLTI